MQENREKYYPSGISDEGAAKIFKEEWTLDYQRRLKMHEEGMESIAGYGSSLWCLTPTIENLPKILKKYNINTILDAPCGDFYWMKNVDLSCVEYIGVDLINEQVERNKEMFPNIDFRALDMVRDELPKSDLIFTRDSLIHLSYYDIFLFLKNCVNSGAKYLMSSTYADLDKNEEMGGIVGWRFINFEKPPFNFPSPLELINENSQVNPIKCIGMWDLSDIKTLL